MCPFGLRGGKWLPDSTGRGGDRVSYRRHLADCRWPAVREGSQTPEVSAVPSPCLGEIRGCVYLGTRGGCGPSGAVCLSVPRRTRGPGLGPSRSWAHVAGLTCGVTAQGSFHTGLPGTRADRQPPGRKDRGRVPSGRQSLPKRRGRRPGQQPPSCRGTLRGCLLARSGRVSVSSSDSPDAASFSSLSWPATANLAG